MTTSDMIRELCEKNEYQYIRTCPENWAITTEFLIRSYNVGLSVWRK